MTRFGGAVQAFKRRLHDAQDTPAILTCWRCQVGEWVDTESLPLIGRSRCDGDADNLAPGAEGIIAGVTMLSGGEAMAAELEVVVDPTMGGEETLRVTR